MFSVVSVITSELPTSDPAAEPLLSACFAPQQVCAVASRRQHSATAWQALMIASTGLKVLNQ
jgi:hypothetical protein